MSSRPPRANVGKRRASTSSAKSRMRSSRGRRGSEAGAFGEGTRAVVADIGSSPWKGAQRVHAACHGAGRWLVARKIDDQHAADAGHVAHANFAPDTFDALAADRE